MRNPLIVCSNKYIYDLSDRLTKIKGSKGNVLTYGFDENNKVSEVNDLVNGTTYTTGFDFDKDSRVKVISYTREQILPNQHQSLTIPMIC